MVETATSKMVGAKYFRFVEIALLTTSNFLEKRVSIENSYYSTSYVIIHTYTYIYIFSYI